MGYDHSELGVVASTSTSAIAMVVVTVVCIIEVKLNLQRINYPEAQHRLTFLLMAPIIIGWLTFCILYTPEYDRIITAALLGYKAAYLYNFNRYCERLLGWTMKNGDFVHSREKSMECLQAIGEESHAAMYKCFGKIPLFTKEQADMFLRRTWVLVFQLMVVLLMISLLIIILEFAIPYDYYEYGRDSFAAGFIYICVIRSISTAIATYRVLLFCTVMSHVPRLKPLKILWKFTALKFAVLLPENQPLILSVLAAAGLIADDYSRVEQMAFVNSLLVIDEMLILACVQWYVFGPEDYSKHYEEVMIGGSTIIS